MRRRGSRPAFVIRWRLCNAVREGACNTAHCAVCVVGPCAGTGFGQLDCTSSSAEVGQFFAEQEFPVPAWWRTIDFPRQAFREWTDAQRKAHHGASEEHIQGMWANAMGPVIAMGKRLGVFVKDTHVNKYLKRRTGVNSRAPDATIATRAWDVEPCFADILGLSDNKAATTAGKFSQKHVGGVVCYGIILFHRQPWRKTIPLSLFDGRWALCMNLSRLSGGMHHLLRAETIDTSKAAGAALFGSFLLDTAKSGHIPFRRPQTTGMLLGCGKSGAVFQHANGTCVVKVFHTKDNAVREAEILHALTKHASQLRVAEAFDPKWPQCLVLTPTFRAFPTWDRFDSQLAGFLRSLVDGDGHLRRLHKQNFVHCDLRPPNIMMDANGRATLVDFGAARATRKQSLVDSGALAFGSPHMLANWNAEAILSAADDLIAFGHLVQSVMFRGLCQSEILRSGDCQKIQAFWEQADQGTPSVSTLMHACQAVDYDGVVEWFRPFCAEGGSGCGGDGAAVAAAAAGASSRSSSGSSNGSSGGSSSSSGGGDGGGGWRQ
jgi:uncharacterized membrane protein YgcG